MSNRLKGHVALVTGAAGGIGQAFAVKLASEGASVAVVDLAEGTSTVAAIESAGGIGASFIADVSSPEQISALAESIQERLGTTDILVNNAGIYPQVNFGDLTIDLWRKVFAVNVEAMFLTCQAFTPAMAAQGWGRVVNVASNSIGMQVPGMTHYIASKMAVIGLTRGLATELGVHGVTANVIAPSPTRTPGTSALPEEGFVALAQMQSIKRPGLPEDLTGALAFLASDDAAFVTGQTFYVDGGLVRSS